MTKKILILANNTTWSSWPDKVKQIQDFYTPFITLQITVIHTEFKNVPLVLQTLGGNVNGVDTPVNGYTVDHVWFETKIDMLGGATFDCIVFCLDEGNTVPNTGLVPAGVNCGLFNGVDQITMFIQPNSENWPAAQNGVLQDNAIAYLICHELSHWFYNMLQLQDKTHLYFYSNHPKGCIKDFMNNTIYQEAKKALGTSLVPIGDDPDVGCAISVTYLLKEKCGIDIKETLSTSDLLTELINNPHFTEITTPQVGGIIISATGTSTISDTPITHGHCGVVGLYGVLSNNSLNGLWSENYTLETWHKRYGVDGGYPTRFFQFNS